MRFIVIVYCLLVFAFSATAQIVPPRVGRNSFTIQYIPCDKKNKSGTATIRSIGADGYNIEGEQRDKLKNHYVTIKDTFLTKGRELKFNGKIVSRICYVNNGPCESTGTVVFKASGNRKYWRLRRILNCDGIFTYYIDTSSFEHT